MDAIVEERAKYISDLLVEKMAGGFPGGIDILNMPYFPTTKMSDPNSKLVTPPDYGLTVQK